MSYEFSERRGAVRFPIHGPVEVQVAGLQFAAQVHDVSLNGALLSKPAECTLQKGDRLELVLSLNGIPHVHASAVVAHVHEDRIGVEFSDMGQQDFDIFSGLVLMLDQQNRPDWAGP